MSRRMQRFWLLAWEFSWGLSSKARFVPLVVSEHLKVKISGDFTSQHFLSNKELVCVQLMKWQSLGTSVCAWSQQKILEISEGGWRRGRFVLLQSEAGISGDSFFLGQIPSIPPSTSHSCGTAPVGVLYKLLGYRFPQKCWKLGISIRSDIPEPAQSSSWDFILPRLEGTQGYKHQLLISGPWWRSTRSLRSCFRIP